MLSCTHRKTKEKTRIGNEISKRHLRRATHCFETPGDWCPPAFCLITGNLSVFNIELLI